MGKLTKPAKVGVGTFGVGVPEHLVIKAAQRNYVYAEKNPFCLACQEPDCKKSFNGRCEMIRIYLKTKNSLPQ